MVFSEKSSSNKIASESGHWYTRAGLPAYTMTGKNGNERNVTLRDARKLDLVPSVTTILGLMNKPGLNRWLIQQTLLAALTLPKEENESLDAYADRVMDDSKAQGRDAMDLGTQIHGSLEKAYEGREVIAEHKNYVSATMAAIADKFPGQTWKAEKSFAHELGFGGKIDLNSESVVIDFKTKAFTIDDKVDAYEEHKMQLAAYAKGLGLTDYRSANVFVSTVDPGLVKIVEHTKDDMNQAWDMFYHLLKFWQIKNRHGS